MHVAQQCIPGGGTGWQEPLVMEYAVHLPLAEQYTVCVQQAGAATAAAAALLARQSHTGVVTGVYMGHAILLCWPQTAHMVGRACLCVCIEQ
jgi:hypothetical protein